MNEESSPVSDTSQFVGRLPFLAVLCTFFFSGGVFLVFTFPILLKLANGNAVCGLSALFTGAIVDYWTAALRGATGGVFAPAALFISLIVGLVLVPVSRLVASGSVEITRVLERRLARRTRKRQRPFFSASTFAEPLTAEFTSWLVHRPTSKAHWEWVYFLYLLHWDVFTNALIFYVCSSYLLHRGGNAVVFGVVGAAICFLLFLYALVRSYSMGETHEFYFRQFHNDRSPSNETARSQEKNEV